MLTQSEAKSNVRATGVLTLDANVRTPALTLGSNVRRGGRKKAALAGGSLTIGQSLTCGTPSGDQTMEKPTSPAVLQAVRI